MLAVSIAIMVVGAVLLFAEAVTPGFAVFGVTGIVLLVVSAILTLFYVPYGVMLVCCEVGVLGIGGFLFVRRVKRKKLYGQLILEETLNEDNSKKTDLTVYLGKSGYAKTSLRPAGVAEIEGESVEVVSDGVYIAENTKISVKEISAGKIIVTQTIE